MSTMALVGASVFYLAYSLVRRVFGHFCRQKPSFFNRILNPMDVMQDQAEFCLSDFMPLRSFQFGPKPPAGISDSSICYCRPTWIRLTALGHSASESNRSLSDVGIWGEPESFV